MYIMKFTQRPGGLSNLTRRSSGDKSAHPYFRAPVVFHQFQSGTYDSVPVLLTGKQAYFNRLPVIGDFTVTSDKVVEVHLDGSWGFAPDVLQAGDAHAGMPDRFHDDVRLELFLRGPGGQAEHSAGLEMRREGDQRPVQVFRCSHESDGTPQTYRGVELPADSEVSHVDGVKLYIRELLPGDSQHFRADIQTGNGVARTPVRDMPTRAAGNIEEVIAVAQSVLFYQRQCFFGFGLIFFRLNVELVVLGGHFRKIILHVYHSG